MQLVDDEDEPVGSACRFLDHLADRGFSPNTLRAYAYDLKYLFTFLSQEDMDWRDFSAPHALRLLAFLRRTPSRRAAQRFGLAAIAGGPDTPGRLLAPSTVNRILAAVSSFYERSSRRSTRVTPPRCRHAPILRWPGWQTAISRSWGGPAVSSQFVGR
ncbi:site-specific integrase [Streptomyces sp. NBC_01210]|uniref:site-specific integrase n=1 Tax=Streptomyces sp. NBC_01210 TaxID=2903774 RepID=UPI003FA3A609